MTEKIAEGYKQHQRRQPVQPKNRLPEGGSADIENAIIQALAV